MGKTIAIIPARGGSKRLVGKNILNLGGLPLLIHSIKYAQKHKFIHEIFVSTDDEDIKKVAIKAGVKVIDRPTSISGDFEPTVSALKHVIQNCNEIVENIILLQPTNPLRPINLLSEAFSLFEKKKCESLFTVTRNNYKLGKIVNHKFVAYNYKIGQRSQDLEPLFYENGLLYIIKASQILSDTIITENAYPLEVNHPFSSVDIDTQEDLDYAEYLLKKSNL
jgi:N-acylneuraminate cytidylyltransferase